MNLIQGARELFGELRDGIGGVVSFPQDFLGVFGLPPAESGAIVNEFSAIQISTYFACMRVISDAVGTIPLRVMERLPDGGEQVAYDHPYYDLFHTQPNPEVPAADLRQAAQSHALLTGNAYVEIDWANGGYPRALWLRSCFSTFPYRRQATGELIYKTHDNPSGMERNIEASDMIHVKGLGIDSIVGLSPVKYHMREVLGADLAAQSYGAKFFAHQANPSGYLQSPGALTPEQKLKAMTSWLDGHSRGNSHRPAILEGGWKWETTGIAPEEAQFLETRMYNREQIAAMFGVPAHMVGGKEDSKANMEQKAQEFLTFCLKPWLKKWEQAINMKIFPKVGRTAGKFFVKFDTTELERADFKTMCQGIQMARYAGLTTTDEGRKELKLNPYDVKQLDSLNPGDKLLMPVNMQYVSKDMLAGPPEEPAKGNDTEGEPESQPAPKVTEPSTEKNAIKPYFAQYSAVFRDAFGRILARKDAAKKDYHRCFSPVLISLASAMQFPIDGEPGEIVLSADNMTCVHDYIDGMVVRGTEWKDGNPDVDAALELKRAVKFLLSHVQVSKAEPETELSEE